MLIAGPAPTRSVPFPLLDLAFDNDTRRKFAGPKALQSEDVTLVNAAGLSSRLLVTSRLSSDSFGQYVAKFTNKGEREWLAVWTLRARRLSTTWARRGRCSC